VLHRKQQPPDDASPRRSRRAWRRSATGVGQDGADSSAATMEAEGSEQARIIAEALDDLRDMDVREVMTPRVDVTYLTIPVHAEDIARAVRTSGHSCFPVVHDDLDDLIGLLFVNDIFRTGGRPTNGRGENGDAGRDATDPSPLEISRKVRQPHLVPESLGVLEALADLRKHRRAVAVVVDEYGGVAGLLTIKDLLEPLVGDLHDEFDEAGESHIVRVDNTRWLIDGQTNVDDVRERLGIDIPDGEYVTLGGLLFERFGHIPTKGEEVRVADWILKVVEMDKRRVAQVVATYAGAGEETSAMPAPAGDEARNAAPAANDDGEASA
jgi:CBS domain containing-hemolysin-like protein